LVNKKKNYIIFVSIITWRHAIKQFPFFIEKFFFLPFEQTFINDALFCTQKTFIYNNAKSNNTWFIKNVKGARNMTINFFKWSSIRIVWIIETTFIALSRNPRNHVLGENPILVIVWVWKTKRNETNKIKKNCIFIGLLSDFIDFLCAFTVKTTEHTVASYESSDFTWKFLTVMQILINIAHFTFHSSQVD
jgi:hypothetical protein